MWILSLKKIKRAPAGDEMNYHCMFPSEIVKNTVNRQKYSGTSLIQTLKGHNYNPFDLWGLQVTESDISEGSIKLFKIEARLSEAVCTASMAMA